MAVSSSTRKAPAPKPAPVVNSTRILREQRRKARELFQRGRRAEVSYARSLRAVARQVGEIVRGFGPNVNESLTALGETLTRYAQALRPWATSVARRMAMEAAQRDASAWASLGRLMGRSLHREIQTAPTGEALRSLLDEQVELITSLPLEAARRVHRLVLKNLEGGIRYDQLAEEIEKTGHVTRSRAQSIARTETGRVAGALVEARAEYIGSPGYFWRTRQDGDVRPLHRKLEGKFIKWSDPPIAGENGERAHAGMIYECRCWMEPVIPDTL